MEIKRTFLSAYSCDSEVRPDSVAPNFLFGARGAAEMFSVFSGASFEEGLYRLHEVGKIQEWTHVVCEAFPQFNGRIECFAFDWLGRMFALDSKRLVEGEAGVLMLEPGTGLALEIPANFLTFHCDELIDYADAALARAAYADWRMENPAPLSHSECAGYKIPLFLGGADTVSNMERADVDVYWELCVQLLRQTRASP